MASLLLPLGAALALASSEPGPEPREPCPATELWHSLAVEIPEAPQHDDYRARIAWGLDTSAQADDADDERTALELCLASVQGYADAAVLFHYDTEPADLAQRRADAIIVDLESRLDAQVPPRPIFSPPPSELPQQQWDRRHRRLVAQVSVSAAATVLGLAVTAGPWIYHAACNPPPYSPHGCTDGTDLIVAIHAGPPILAAAAVALTVWSVRLARHRRLPPPGLRWSGSTVRLEPTASSLSLRF